MDDAPLYDTPGMLEPGSRVGPYEIRGVVGKGGFGTVYRAWDERLGREVAVKVLAKGVGSAPGSLDDLEQEARILASLSHPGVLGIFDVGEDGGRRWVATELLQGVNLRERLGEGRLPWRTAAAIVLEAAKGLTAAHACNIVHLDLKPENIFVLAHGGVKILDFGLARRVQAPATGARQEGEVATAGTLNYLAPEQLAGRPVDHRADLFALGVVLHELLTGRPPFKRDGFPETMAAILKESPPPPTPPGAAIPPGLVRVVRRCLEKAPDARFQTALDLALALSEELARPATVSAPRAQWPVRLGFFLAGAATALVTLLLVRLLSS